MRAFIRKHLFQILKHENAKKAGNARARVKYLCARLYEYLISRFGVIIRARKILRIPRMKYSSPSVCIIGEKFFQKIRTPFVISSLKETRSYYEPRTFTRDFINLSINSTQRKVILTRKVDRAKFFEKKKFFSSTNRIGETARG